MRTLLALAAVLTSFQSTSSAFGDSEPPMSVHRVTLHGGKRSFVVLGDAPQLADRAWQRVVLHSYDDTQVAELSMPPVSHTFTLVGVGGTRIVAADHEVVLRRGWQLDGQGPGMAVEVPFGASAIALDGRVPDAQWHELEDSDSKIKHTDLGLDVKIDNGRYTVLMDGRVVNSGPGNLLGILGARGALYLIVETERGKLETLYFSGQFS